MKPFFVASLIAVFCLAVPATMSHGIAPSPGGIVLDGRLNCPYISHRGGRVFLQLSIVTPDIGTTKRRPMNLSVVLDRSGSMGDESKMEHAKKALFSLIDQLQSEDILSLVIYDDVVEVLKSAGPVGKKSELKRLIQRVHPRGSTNLGGGMVEGFRQAERYAGREYTNRVILLSDGLANTGVTDPRELGRIARRNRSKSITLTSMGVGLDYNENLMMTLAENGGGNYYFIESSHSLASIMNKEFNRMSKVIARNAALELTLGKGVTLKNVIGCESDNERDHYTLPIGDLYSSDRREFTVELEIPEGSLSAFVASGTLRYDSDQSWLQSTPSFTTTIHYTTDAAVIEKNRDLETQAKADIALSTRKVERAMEALDEGKPEEAAKEIDDARQMILSSPAAGSSAGAGILGDQASKLDSFQKTLKDSDAKKAKKSIQYENYKVQKQIE